MTRGAERAAGCPCLWAAAGAGPGDLGARRWRGPAGRCTPLGACAWGSGGGIGGPAPAWRHRKATASPAASCGVFWGVRLMEPRSGCIPAVTGAARPVGFCLASVARFCLACIARFVVHCTALPAQAIGAVAPEGSGFPPWWSWRELPVYLSGWFPQIRKLCVCGERGRASRVRDLACRVSGRECGRAGWETCQGMWGVFGGEEGKSSFLPLPGVGECVPAWYSLRGGAGGDGVMDPCLKRRKKTPLAQPGAKHCLQWFWILSLKSKTVLQGHGVVT